MNLIALVPAALVASYPVIIDTEWRGMAFADHLSHGPGVGLHIGLLEDHLRLGLAGFARPGPVNPATFTLDLDDPYNGQDSLDLRSDGGLMGLSVAVGQDLGPVRVDVAAMLGYGGFGFYLVGEDRQTPDGSLPSTWEDSLMDGRDSSLGLGLDIGPKVTWAASDSLRPYVAVRYSTIFGYDAYMAEDYSGFSLAVGLSAGNFAWE